MVGTAGELFAIVHPAYNLAGTDTVPGLAGQFTIEARDAEGALQTLSYSQTELSTPGWYSFEAIYPTTGQWTVTVQNPPTTNMQRTTYRPQMMTSRVDGTSGLLTTRDRVERRFTDRGLPTPHLDLVDDLILEVSAKLLDRMGRSVHEARRVHYFSGRGHPFIDLHHGPIVTIHGVWSVEVAADDQNDPVETLTEIAVDSFVGMNWRDEGARRPAHLIRRSPSVWQVGHRNYKVDMTAGWDTVPETLVGLATKTVVMEYLGREAAGMSSKNYGEFQDSYQGIQNLEQAINRSLAEYTRVGIA